jgi:translocation protein SEC63
MNVYFQGSSQAEIKKSYRKLSLILHPDKETGNEKAFMKLTKGDIFVS